MNFHPAKFLQAYGYLPQRPSKAVEQLGFLAWSQSEWLQAVAEAQRTYGLNDDGKLTKAVEKVWERTPRCGHQDHFLEAREFQPKWGVGHLLYHVKHYPTGLDLTKPDVDSLVKAACDDITGNCHITFEATAHETEANIVMLAGRGQRAGFDGAGGTLAYAYPPKSANYIGTLTLVWDLDEAWSSGKSRNGILFKNVTEHELIHNLGLDHDPTPKQLMNAFYTREIATVQSNDRQRLINLYGEPAPFNPPPPPPATPTDVVSVAVVVNGKSYGPKVIS